MKQQSLGVFGFEKYRKQTRKEIFLAQMDEILPWAELCAIIEPFYPSGQVNQRFHRMVYSFAPCGTAIKRWATST